MQARGTACRARTHRARNASDGLGLCLAAAGDCLWVIYGCFEKVGDRLLLFSVVLAVDRLVNEMPQVVGV